MSVTIKAHFDGKVIVPDEPINLPIDMPLNAELELVSESGPEWNIDYARKAWEELKSNPIHGLHISDESLRRENLYEERL